MTTFCSAHTPYAELDTTARALLSIYAMGASARFGANPPDQEALVSILEAFWNLNELTVADIRDPDRMTVLLRDYFKSTSFPTQMQGGACHRRAYSRARKLHRLE